MEGKGEIEDSGEGYEEDEEQKKRKKGWEKDKQKAISSSQKKPQLTFAE